MATSAYLTSYQGISGTPHSYNVTLATTFTGKIVVTVAMESSSSVSSVTFDGASMTLDRSHDNGALLKIRTFYLDLTSKAAGTYSVNIALSAGAGLISSAFALTDVAAGGSEAFGTSNSTPGTATLTATASAALIAATVSSSGSVTHTFSGDVTEQNDQVVTAAFGAAVADASNVAAGTRTVTSTPSAGTNALLLSSYAHSGGGGGGGEIRRRIMLRTPKNTQEKIKNISKLLFGGKRVIEPLPGFSSSNEGSFWWFRRRKR